MNMRSLKNINYSLSVNTVVLTLLSIFLFAGRTTHTESFNTAIVNKIELIQFSKKQHSCVDFNKAIHIAFPGILIPPYRHLATAYSQAQKTAYTQYNSRYIPKRHVAFHLFQTLHNKEFSYS